MSHHLRYFRFSNRTHIELKEDLKMEEFFAERSNEETSEDALRIAGPIRMRNNSTSSQGEAPIKPKRKTQTPVDEQILLDSGHFANLGDEYVMNRLVEKQKKIKQDEQLPEVENGRVFIFPSLQFNVIGFREDETTFTALLKFFQTPGNGLQKLQLATGYLNL